MSNSYVVSFALSLPGIDMGARGQARDLVRRSSGVERTRVLACGYANKALEILQHLPESEARGALEVLTERVVKRTW
jgi:hexaprenyl-diphosphate synthase